MEPGLTVELLLAAVATGVFSLWVASRDLPVLVSVAVVFVRILAPVWYFAWYPGTWTFLDDQVYYQHGRQLLSQDFSPWTILFTEHGVNTLQSAAGGRHILYTWWNYLAQLSLGPFYYSAVFFNVGLTFVAGAILYRICRLAGFHRQYSQGLLLFFLLHWDIIAWSSFVNLKDILVLTLSLASFYMFLLFTSAEARTGKVYSAVGLVIAIAALLWIRFYVPVLLLLSIGVWVVLKQPGWKKYVILGGAAGAMFFVMPRVIPVEHIQVAPSTFVVGIFRFFMTPRPWAVEWGYSFLVLPSYFHWFIVVPSLFGAWMLWRRSAVGALVLIYLAGVGMFYAVVPELQGPRQRVQVAPVLIWMQFQFLYHLLMTIAPVRQPRLGGEQVLSGA